MKSARRGAWAAVAVVPMFTGLAWAEARLVGTNAAPSCASPNGRQTVARNLTEQVDQRQLRVLEVSKAEGRLVVKPSSGSRISLSCNGDTVVVTDRGARGDLSALQPGDIVKVDSAPGNPSAVILLRPAWRELASPEQ